MSDLPASLLHEAVRPLAFLLGTWRGGGEGSYPTIDDFAYAEEISFGHVSKPFLAYGQRTRHAETGFPLHAETGYLRLVAGDRVEFVLAHPTGLLESLSGSFRPSESGGVLELACPEVVTTETASDVRATRRLFTIDGDTLTYEVAMEAVGQPMTHHLSATLTRA